MSPFPSQELKCPFDRFVSFGLLAHGPLHLGGCKPRRALRRWVTVSMLQS
jgi:hypothetical protein